MAKKNHSIKEIKEAGDQFDDMMLLLEVWGRKVGFCCEEDAIRQAMIILSVRLIELIDKKDYESFTKILSGLARELCRSK